MSANRRERGIEMKKDEAIRLLDRTFRSEFDEERYIRFVKEVFNTLDIRPSDKTKYIAQQYRGYISEFRKIGEYHDSKRGRMEILAVKLKRTSSRDRARTMQRNFIADWLSKTRMDAALVAFYGDEKEDWRLSFVKMEYTLDENGNAITELTPARRYSFLVGVNEPNHTCAKQFLDIVMNDRENPLISEIEAVFSIDNVTKEFFDEYRKLFLELKESLDSVIAADENIRREFEEKGISSVDFSKKLLGQIVFIYFLQKKGWLGVETGKEWGTGPKNFLRRLYDGEYGDYENFFNDMLEPLFYEALAVQRDNDYYRLFKCRIPFLNGGLFEPLNDYDWTGTSITLDNEIFGKILDTFDRFNFTVKEDEPLEKEVAVDPEMLGKVFENLLEVKDRKSRGAFYTPREIVHYMCQQSLINYLETNTEIPREEIERFIIRGDAILDKIIREHDYGKEDISRGEMLPASIKKNYREIDRLLKEIKIVDPAVGSGAFPVGMLNEIVKARNILTVFFPENERSGRNAYALKRETIENSLYGVDIDSSAVEIAKLRFWLSLIVDEEDMRNIKPLPNLDHKIMCGNSLLEEFEGVKLFDEKLLGDVGTKSPAEAEIAEIEGEIRRLQKELNAVPFGQGGAEVFEKADRIEELKRKKKRLLEKSKGKKEDGQRTIDEAAQRRIRESKRKLKEYRKLQKEYFNEQNRKRKTELREEMDGIEWELIEATLKEQGNEEAMMKLERYRKAKSKPFFLWKLYFFEVFQRENPGFDVVIGNPPYAQIPKGIVSAEKYPYSEGKDKGKQNLYKVFIELAYNRVREKGTVVLIVQSSLLCDISSQYTRELLLTKTLIDGFIEFPKKAQTKEKQVFESVLQGTCVFSFKKIIPCEKDCFFISIENDRSTVNNLKKERINQLAILNIYPNGFFIPLIKPGEFSLIMKLSNNPPFKLFLKNSKQGDLNLSTNKNLIVDYDTGIKFYRGKNVHRYFFDRRTEEFMDLEKNKSKKMQFAELNEHNMEVRDLILMQQITGTTDEHRLHACLFSKERCLFGHSVRVIELKDKDKVKTILALLNSKLLDWFFRKTSTNNNVNGYELDQLPIKYDTNKKIVSLVDQILSITDDNDYLDNPGKQARVKELEREIDRLVYELYGLTEEEIEVVEGFGT